MKELKLANKIAIFAFALCLGFVVVGFGLYLLLPTEDAIPRSVNVPKVPYVVCVTADNATIDTGMILVDLSDTTNFPHTATNEVIVRGFYYQGGLDAANHWDLYWGVMLENDATDGSAMWLHRQHRNKAAPFDERRPYAGYGLNTRVTDGALVYATTNFSLTASSIFSSGAVITSSIGMSSPAVGDIVVFLDEVEDSAHLEYTICVDYNTE